MIDRRFLHEQLAHDLSGVVDKRIAICGCGAIGSNLAESLARRGFNHFWLIDDDRIEPHNISTQIWTEQDVGKAKATTLANRLYAISKVRAIPHVKHIRTQADLKRLMSLDMALVVDSFDNRAARACTVGVHPNVLHIGLSAVGTSAICWDENYTLPQDVELEDPCAYPLARSLIELTIATAASVIIAFLTVGEKRVKGSIVGDWQL